MSPALTVAIMMSNYFHDVATAMLAASGAVLLALAKKFERADIRSNAEARQYFISVTSSMKRVARFSLYWLLLGGVPRTLAFRSFEWTTAREHGQIPALIGKHIIAFAVVAFGIWLWLKANKRIKAMLGEGQA